MENSEENKQALAELQEALKELSMNNALPLKEKALVLEAINKIEDEKL